MHERINDFLNGMPMMLLSALLMAAGLMLGATHGLLPAHSGGHGMFFTLREPLVGDPVISAGLNALCLIAMGVFLLSINKIFTFVRSLTRLPASVFFMLCLGVPALTGSLHVGTALSMLFLLSVVSLFSSYGDPHSQRDIFMLMLLCSLGTMFHYSFLLLGGIIIVGFVIMRAMNLRSVLAAGVGLVTPFWIMLGLGVVTPAQFRWPELSPVWQQAATPQFIAVAVVIALTLVLAATSAFTIMKYRLQLRDYNLFFILSALLLSVGIILDSAHLAAYVPTLVLCTAVLVAQVFSASRLPLRHLPVQLLALACLVSAVLAL